MGAFEELADTLTAPSSGVHGGTLREVLCAIARQTAGGVRRDLAERLRVSAGTVSKAVQLAIKAGLVEEKQPLALRPGRPLVPLSLSSDRYFLIGITVITARHTPDPARPDQARRPHVEGPDHLLGKIISLDGTPLPGFEVALRRDLKSTDEPDDPDGSLLLNQIEEFGRLLIETFEETTGGPRSTARLLGCGVTLSGHVDHERGTVRSTGWGAPTENWRHRDFGPELTRRLGIDVTCDNDVSSLAVRLNLRPRDERDDPGPCYALVAVLDHGVGGALVLRDRTRRGFDSMASEPGHLPVGDVVRDRPEGDDDPLWSWDDLPRCQCETHPEAVPRGHVQAFAAPDSILARAVTMELVAATADTSMAELSARPRAEGAVSRLFHQGGVALGRALVSAVNWLNPGRIVVYLPPALAETNPYLAGSHYRRGLHSEITQNTFSVDYTPRLIVKSVPHDDMKERLAAAAAYLVFAHLLDTVAGQPGSGRSARLRDGDA